MVGSLRRQTRHRTRHRDPIYAIAAAIARESPATVGDAAATASIAECTASEMAAGNSDARPHPRFV
jgi:hypothetical protein